MRNSMFRKGLVIGIIILFIGAAVLPASGTVLVRKTSNPLFNGNILYVGGTGEGNYTKIQDAINDSSAGDTVYVYSGTYFEDVKVNTSIVLQGEDKESTIIHGGGFGSGDGVILVSANNVEITGFSVRNSCPYFPGSGIGLYSTEQCIVTDNIVYDCFIGIHAFITSDVTISKNTVTDSEFGIRVQRSKRNIITRNTMQDNNRGMELNGVNFNEITENNFINNDRHFYFYGVFLNTIDSNYWERLVNIGPKPIIGILFLLIPIPWLIIDWHPAKEPYDIYNDGSEDAIVTAHGISGQIKLILVKGGQNYGEGYEPSDVNIFIEGQKVTPVETWVVGGEILLGQDATGNWTVGETCPAGDYSVTVSIMDTVVYNGVVTVT